MDRWRRQQKAGGSAEAAFKICIWWNRTV